MLRVAHAVFAGVLSADAKVEGCAQRRSEPTQVAARRGEEGEERTVLAGQRVALALLVDLGELGKLQHLRETSAESTAKRAAALTLGYSSTVMVLPAGTWTRSNP